MSHQDSLVDFCFSEPAGLLCSKKHFHCYLFATPLSHPDFSIATFSNLLHHLNLLCDGPLNLWNAKADLIPCPVKISVFTSLLLCLLPTQPARERVEYAEYAAIVTWISATLHHCGCFPSSPGHTAGEDIPTTVKKPFHASSKRTVVSQETESVFAKETFSYEPWNFYFPVGCRVWWKFFLLFLEKFWQKTLLVTSMQSKFQRGV